jgi:hypothetical protein
MSEDILIDCEWVDRVLLKPYVETAPDGRNPTRDGQTVKAKSVQQ